MAKVKSMLLALIMAVGLLVAPFTSPAAAGVTTAECRLYSHYGWHAYYLRPRTSTTKASHNGVHWAYYASCGFSTHANYLDPNHPHR